MKAKSRRRGRNKEGKRYRQSSRDGSVEKCHLRVWETLSANGSR